MRKRSHAVAWRGASPPQKILVMRFQALGDTVVTLPYLQSLKRQYPDVELHFFTREEVSAIPTNVGLFRKVIAIGGGRNAKIQFLLALLQLPWLIGQKYDAILDLQNHKISRIIRKLLPVRTFSEFDVDRQTVLSAGERTRRAIEALWSWKIELDTNFVIRNAPGIDDLLRRHGWKSNHDMVVLNPAGCFPSRNLPLDHYISFAKLWLEKINEKTQFVLLLLPALQTKANYIARALGDRCINLTGKADQTEAFAILRKCKFVLSEDGGLMHMGWVNGTPTLALFSSSKRQWAAPQGKWSDSVDSSDLECGPCDLAVCKFNDNRCLTRHDATALIARAASLLNSKNLK
ncbi:MAG TPA: glycosyltransferase family 9 protein [Chryseolinea sp.]